MSGVKGRQVQLEGELEWIDASKLTVDPMVNTRPLNRNSVHKIAKNFDSDSFGAIHVNRRPNGVLSVMDGQTRLAALREMGWGDQKVPCVVAGGLSIEQEARVFKRLNADRTRPSAIALFHSDLTAREPHAIEIQAVLDRLGLRLQFGDQPNYVSAITSLILIHAAGGQGLLSEVLQIAGMAWKGKQSTYSGDLLRGIAFFLMTYSKQVDSSRLVDRLSREEPSEILHKARLLKTANGSSVPLNMVGVLVGTYNWRLQEEHKLDPFVPVKNKKQHGLSATSVANKRSREVSKPRKAGKKK